jgi:hypothetical protein
MDLDLSELCSLDRHTNVGLLALIVDYINIPLWHLMDRPKLVNALYESEYINKLDFNYAIYTRAKLPDPSPYIESIKILLDRSNKTSESFQKLVINCIEECPNMDILRIFIRYADTSKIDWYATYRTISLGNFDKADFLVVRGIYYQLFAPGN